MPSPPAYANELQPLEQDPSWILCLGRLDGWKSSKLAQLKADFAAYRDLKSQRDFTTQSISMHVQALPPENKTAIDKWGEEVTSVDKGQKTPPALRAILERIVDDQITQSGFRSKVDKLIAEYRERLIRLKEEWLHARFYSGSPDEICQQMEGIGLFR